MGSIKEVFIMPK